MKAIFIAGLAAALVASSTHAQHAVSGSPCCAARAAPRRKTLGIVPIPHKRPPSHRPPKSRSAAALALSADPVFDEGTYQRIKETLLGYAAIQVRGGWPAIPADAKLAAGSERARGGLAAQAAGDFRRSGA